MQHYTLDARNLLCPMPVLKAQEMAKNLHNGDILTVIATDPGAQFDVPCWCRINGHKIIQLQKLQGETHITFELIKEK